MLRLLISGLLARKIRLALTLVSITIGVAAIAGAFMFTDSVDAAFTKIFAEASAGIDVAVAHRDATKVSAYDQGAIDRNTLRIPSRLVDTIRDVPGVKTAAGTIQGFAQMYDSRGKPVGGQGPPTFGFSWIDAPELTPFSIASGRAPRDRHETAIDRQSAKQAKVRIGDSIRIVFDQGRRSERFVITGFIRFGSSDATQGVTYSVFAPATARTVFASGDRFDGIGVAALPGVTQSELARRIQDVLPSNVVAITGKQQTQDQLKQVEQGIGFLRTAMLAIAVITLFVGTFVIFNTFSIIVAQRTRELGLLRAVGATRRQLLVLVLAESAVVGAASSVIGIFAGVGVARGITALLESFDVSIPKSSLELHPRTIIICCIVGIVVTMVASIVPALRASRTTALEALRSETTGRVMVSTMTVIIGAMLATASIAVIIFMLVDRDRSYQTRLIGIGGGFAALIIGVSMMAPLLVRPVVKLLDLPLRRGTVGVLASANARRSPRRTAATAAALMIGIGLASFMAVFTDSAATSIDARIDATIGADFILSNSAHGSYMPASTIAKVAATPGVASAVELRSTSVEITAPKTTGWDRKFLNAVPGSQRAQALSLSMISGSSQLTPRTILIVASEAKKLGVRSGSRVELRAPRGAQRSFIVGGIFSATGSTNYLISSAAHDRLYPPSARLPAAILVNGSDTTSSDQLRRNLRSSLKGSSAFVRIQDQSDIKNEVRTSLNQLFGLLTALLMLALLIALIGIVNTLALSVFERTREIGLLRAVGMTRWQIRSMVMLESILISLLGAALGIALGLGLGLAVAAALKSEGLILAIPVSFIVTIVAAGVVAGFVASILPARRAARLDVLQAISSE